MKIQEMKQELVNKKEEVRKYLADEKVEKAEKTMEEVRTLQKKIAIAEEVAEEEKREVDSKLKNLEKREGQKMEKREIEERAIKNVLLKKDLNEEQRAAITTTNGAAILPKGFVNEIENMRKGYTQLKNYVHVIPVATNTGKMPLSKGCETKKLANLKSDTEMVKEMLALSPVEFACADYGKIIPMENSVIEDTTVGIMDLVTEEFVECAVNTENEKIINAIKSCSKEVEAKTAKDITKEINKLAPTARKRAKIFTNSTGFGYLDSLEDGAGHPLVSYVGEKVIFKDRFEIIEIDNDILTDEPGKVAFYVNDPMKVKFFDRKQYEIGSSVEAGFTYNQTLVRIVERFDTKAVALADDVDMNKFAKKIVITIA